MSNGSRWFRFLLLALPFFLANCAGRSMAQVGKGSRKQYTAENFWNVLAAAQGVLQSDGFVVNLSQQNKGILVATLQKAPKRSKALAKIEDVTGASLRVGDYIRVLVAVQMTKKKNTEMRLSVLRERENEWTQEDGDEVGNEAFYSDFFSRVDTATSGGSSDTPPQG